MATSESLPPAPSTDASAADMRRRAGVTSMRVAYALTFIAFLDTFALLPTMGPYAAALGATGLGMGVVLGAYSVTDLVFNVVGGVMLDRTGRRRLALLGFGIVAFAILLYPVADTVTALVGVRLLHGVGGGLLIPAVYTLIGDLSTSGSRGRAMGKVGAVIATAAVVAPGIAGASRAQFGFTAVFIGLAAMMFVGVVVTARSVRETLTSADRSTAKGLSIRSLLATHHLQVACVAVFGFSAGFGSLSAFLPSRLEAMGNSPALSGGLFTLLALVAAVLMLTRVAARVDADGPRLPVTIGLPAIIVALVVVAFGTSVGTIAVGMVVFGIGFGIVYPAVSGATALAAASPGRGRAFGVFSVAYSSGFVIGPPLAGFLSDRADISPFLTAAGLATLTLAAVLLLPRGERSDAT